MKQILMPTALTAENGAKKLMMGEFSVKVDYTCTLCKPNEPEDDCPICLGGGTFSENHPIEWPTMKAIYAKAASELGEAAKTSPHDSQIASELRGIAVDADDAAPIAARVLREAADRINALSANAARYEHLRAKDLDQAQSGGLFAGLTPDNVVINGPDLDDAIDREMTS